MRSAQAYRETEILSASRGQLLVLTFDGLLTSLTRVRAGAALGNDEVTCSGTDKSRAILCELLATLNRQEGGALADRLAAIYAFLLTELDAAALRRDAARIDRLLAMVRELRDAFAQAAATTPRANVA